jgi:hypothetical protein
MTNEPAMPELEMTENELPVLTQGETVKQVETLVNRITDIQALLTISQSDDRRGVQQAIAARIGTLTLERAMDGSISDEELALAGGGPVEGTGISTHEDIFANPANAAARAAGEQGAVTGGTVDHRTLGTRRVFVLTQDGWMPRNVPVANLAILFADGAKPACGHCGLATCRASRTAGPYDCPQMPKRNFVRCPVCRKRFYDPQNPDGRATVDGEAADPMEISIGTYEGSTPELRIRARLGRHMLAYHSEEAMVLGIRPAPADPMLTSPDRQAVAR